MSKTSFLGPGLHNTVTIFMIFVNIMESKLLKFEKHSMHKDQNTPEEKPVKKEYKHNSIKKWLWKYDVLVLGTFNALTSELHFINK